jgi:catechol 2,3-dioxygenase-like lactoylglutathione lyase family enzyme
MSMYDHIGIKVKHLDASVRFYTAALAPLGYVLCTEGDGYAGFGPKDAPSLWLYTGHASGTHIALSAKSHKAVDGFYQSGLEGGGRDNGKPGIRQDYSPHYYAAFLLDPDGNNVEAVCLK